METLQAVAVQSPVGESERVGGSRLLFVYNADSGLVNGIMDLWHKTVSPQTYACNLCAVTYGPLGMRREWRDFVAGLGRPVEFLHRDELERRFGVRDVALPAVLQVEDDKVTVWLGADELGAAGTLAEMKQLVAGRASRPDMRR
jgi:hypothetical protein